MAPAQVLLADTQVEQFSCGYHYLNCMMALMKRKEELISLVKSFQDT